MGLLGACSGAQSSGQTGSMLVRCETDADCAATPGAFRCSDDGFCVDREGEPVSVPTQGIGGGGSDGGGVSGSEPPAASGGSGGGSGAGGSGGGGGSDACPGCEAVCTCDAPPIPAGCPTPQCRCPDLVCETSDAGPACPGCEAVCACDGPPIPNGCPVPICDCPPPICDSSVDGGGGSGSSGGSGSGGSGGSPASQVGCIDCIEVCKCTRPLQQGSACPICECADLVCDGVVDACTDVGGWGATCTIDDDCAAGERCCTNGAACREAHCIAADECPSCGCLCNSPDTPIATPQGETAIADLRAGDLVLSVHGGRVVAVPVLAVGSRAVTNHAVIRLQLDNGTSIDVSGSHPTADGRRLDELASGDRLGDVTIVSASTVPYEHSHTYDILPASETGTYFAGGALIGSTLFRE